MDRERSAFGRSLDHPLVWLTAATVVGFVTWNPLAAILAFFVAAVVTLVIP